MLNILAAHKIEGFLKSRAVVGGTG